MKKIYIKLGASILSILMAVTMITGATYAWLTLSSSPEAGSIGITIGGSNTIMLAPDLTKTVTDDNGNQKIVHYPGKFDNSLELSDCETYDYLNEVSGLSPVSTADGLYWVLPAYDEETGMLKEISEFTVDGTLEYANAEKGSSGSYIYLDFWMVSPGDIYDIHVSTDTKTNTGSYFIELPGITETEDGNFQIAETQGIVEAIARIGFLTNQETADQTVMDAYEASEDYNAQYTALSGVYNEKGQKPEGEHQFMIYEPNGTKHPSEALADGEYRITKPLWYNPYGNTILEQDINSRLVVQSANHWKMTDSSSYFENIFENAIQNIDDLTAETAASLFYKECHKENVGSYVRSGEFYKSTAQLYAAAVNGIVDAENLKGKSAGATDDVKLTTLQPNIPQRIRMYLWLEGQDADCINSESVAAAGFSLNLELSGANQ